jgi:hypothetical protein
VVRGTGVICRKCNSGIIVTSGAKIAEEFSVRCPACHWRHIYGRDELNAIEQRTQAQNGSAPTKPKL